jgi:hypothetical protein
MGRCGIFTTLCDARKPSGKVFLSLAVATVGVVARDVMNPKGITRKVLRMLGNRFAGRLQEPEADTQRTIRTVEAEVLPGPRDLKRERSGNDAAR